MPIFIPHYDSEKEVEYNWDVYILLKTILKLKLNVKTKLNAESQTEKSKISRKKAKGLAPVCIGNELLLIHGEIKEEEESKGKRRLREDKRREEKEEKEETGRGKNDNILDFSR